MCKQFKHLAWKVLLFISLAPPSGPPTNEIIVVERDEDHITCRMVNDALERVVDIVEGTSQDLMTSIELLVFHMLLLELRQPPNGLPSCTMRMTGLILPLAVLWQLGSPWHYADGLSRWVMRGRHQRRGRLLRRRRHLRHLRGRHILEEYGESLRSWTMNLILTQMCIRPVCRQVLP